MQTDMVIEELLQPIPGDHPAGRDLRYSTVYDRIKEARRSDDPLAQGEWQTQIKTADWKATIELCTRALREQSKDLQIAVWLTEALVHYNGYRGLSAGLQLLLELLERYWQSLHPRIENGDLDYRIGPLTYLNEKLPQAVCQVALCDPDNSRGYSYYAWEESRLVGFGHNLDKEQAKQRQALIDEGKVSAEDFSAAVTSGSISFYRDLVQQLEQCRRHLQRLDALVDEKFAPDPPGLSKLADALEACFQLAGKIYKDKQKSEVIPEQAMQKPPQVPQVGKVAEGGDTTEVAPDDKVRPPDREHAVSDVSPAEKQLWQLAAARLERGELKSALDQLLAEASLAPSVREKNRYLLLLARLCLMAGRPDLARPVAEQLYALIGTLQLEQWEHPAWIAEVIETLYRCLDADEAGAKERTKELFEKLCTLNITRAAAYRVD